MVLGLVGIVAGIESLILLIVSVDLCVIPIIRARLHAPICLLNGLSGLDLLRFLGGLQEQQSSIPGLILGQVSFEFGDGVGTLRRHLRLLTLLRIQYLLLILQRMLELAAFLRHHELVPLVEGLDVGVLLEASSFLLEFWRLRHRFVLQ